MKKKMLNGIIAIMMTMLIAGLAVGCGSSGKSDGNVTGSQTDDEEEFMLDGPPNHDDIPDA